MKTFPGMFIAIFSVVIVIAIVVLVYQSKTQTTKAYNELHDATRSAEASLKH